MPDQPQTAVLIQFKRPMVSILSCKQISKDKGKLAKMIIELVRTKEKPQIGSRRGRRRRKRRKEEREEWKKMRKRWREEREEEEV